MMALREMQEQFCIEYVNDPKRNATQAAIRAGYSKNCARQQASENLTKPDIKARIRELELEQLAHADYKGVALDRYLVNKLIAFIDSDVTDYVQISNGSGDPNRREALDAQARKDNGQLHLDFDGVIFYPTCDMPLKKTTAIKSMEVQNIGNKDTIILAPKIALEDRLSAIKLLAEMRGLKSPDTTVNIEVSAAGITQTIEERRKKRESKAAEGEQDER